MPTPNEGIMVVDGLNELVRAFRVADRGLGRDIRTAIEQAGEPIRQEAQERVRSQISGMARSRLPWWSIRTGVERSTIGYIVPQQRSVNSRTRERYKRPNLAGLIAVQEQAAVDNQSWRVGRVVRRCAHGSRTGMGEGVDG